MQIKIPDIHSAIS